MLIGVTGGIGSGKSTLSRLFVAWGAGLVDADLIAREVTGDGEVLSRLQEVFGNDIVDSEGRLDRQELGRRAFSSRENWERLNAVMRPSLEEKFWKAIEKVAGEEEFVVVDAPLIFEWNTQDRFDVVVVVDADQEMRVRRVQQRSDLGEEEIRQRMAYQLSSAEKRRRADFVVENNGNLEELERCARVIWDRLRESDRDGRR